MEVFNLTDGPGNDPGLFQRIVGTVGSLSRRHPKLLVQCHAGKSRSVITVAAHLMSTQGLSAKEALTFIAVRRETFITPGIEGLLTHPWLLARNP